MEESEYKEEPLRQAYIPTNVFGNVNLLGFSFPVKRLAEGAVSFFILLIAGYQFGYWTLVIDSPRVNFAIGAICGVLGFLVCIMGINKGDVFTFLAVYFKSLSRRRIAKYNPRVKYEDAVARSVQKELATFYGPKKTEAYKSGWQRLVEKVKGKNIEGEKARDAARKRLDDMEADNEYTIFSDDINVVEKRERRKFKLFGGKEDSDAEEE